MDPKHHSLHVDRVCGFLRNLAGADFKFANGAVASGDCFYYQNKNTILAKNRYNELFRIREVLRESNIASHPEKIDGKLCLVVLKSDLVYGKTEMNNIIAAAADRKKHTHKYSQLIPAGAKLLKGMSGVNWKFVSSFVTLDKKSDYYMISDPHANTSQALAKLSEKGIVYDGLMKDGNVRFIVNECVMMDVLKKR